MQALLTPPQEEESKPPPSTGKYNQLKSYPANCSLNVHTGSENLHNSSQSLAYQRKSNRSVVTLYVCKLPVQVCGRQHRTVTAGLRASLHALLSAAGSGLPLVLMPQISCFHWNPFYTVCCTVYEKKCMVWQGEKKQLKP